MSKLRQNTVAFGQVYEIGVGKKKLADTHHIFRDFKRMLLVKTSDTFKLSELVQASFCGAWPLTLLQIKVTVMRLLRHVRKNQ